MGKFLSLSFGRFRRCRRFLLVAHPLVPHGTRFQEGFGFFVQALPVIAVKCGFPQNAESRFRPEVILIVETVHGFENLGRGQPWVLNVRQLMSTLVDHLGVGDHEAILHRVVVKFGAGIRVSDGYLDGLDIQFLGEVDGATDGFVRFPGQAQDEIAVDDQTQLVAILGELPGALDGRALLDVLQDLLVALLVANDQ